jgi:hypothetical protein
MKGRWGFTNPTARKNGVEELLAARSLSTLKIETGTSLVWSVETGQRTQDAGKQTNDK